MTLGESFSLAVDKGGVVMVVLMLLSIFTLGVILLKSYQFYMGKVASNEVADTVIGMLESGQVMRAIDTARLSPSPLGKVMHGIMDVLRDPRLSPPKRHAEIQRIGNSQLRELESYLKSLDMAANVGPLLGLLGTVTGMVAAFAALETAGSRIDPSLLAGGIWEALLNTVAGLAVAIPAMAAYYIFDGMIETFRANLKDATTRLLVYDAAIASARPRQHDSQQQQQQQAQPARAAGPAKAAPAPQQAARPQGQQAPYRPVQAPRPAQAEMRGQPPRTHHEVVGEDDIPPMPMNLRAENM